MSTAMTALEKAKKSADKLTSYVKETDDSELKRELKTLHEALDEIREAGADTKVEEPAPAGYRKRPPNPVDPHLDTGYEKIRHPHTGVPIHETVHPAIRPQEQEIAGVFEESPKKERPGKAK